MTEPITSSNRMFQRFWMRQAGARRVFTFLALVGLVVLTFVVWISRDTDPAEAQKVEDVREYIAKVTESIGNRYGSLCSEEVFVEAGYDFVPTGLSQGDTVPTKVLEKAWDQSERKFNVPKAEDPSIVLESRRVFVFTDAKRTDRSNDKFLLLADAVELRPLMKDGVKEWIAVHTESLYPCDSTGCPRNPDR